MRATKGTFLILLLVAALAAPAISTAQRQRNRPGPGQRPGGGAVARSFEAAAPAIGEPMPDVLVYDDEGTSHRLPDVLRGHYSVLILGCLT